MKSNHSVVIAFAISVFISVVPLSVRAQQLYEISRQSLSSTSLGQSVSGGVLSTSSGTVGMSGGAFYSGSLQPQGVDSHPVVSMYPIGAPSVPAEVNGLGPRYARDVDEGGGGTPGHNPGDIDKPSDQSPVGDGLWVLLLGAMVFALRRFLMRE